jgi:hypothetical protein
VIESHEKQRNFNMRLEWLEIFLQNREGKGVLQRITHCNPLNQTTNVEIFPREQILWIKGALANTMSRDGYIANHFYVDIDSSCVWLPPWHTSHLSIVLIKKSYASFRGETLLATCRTPGSKLYRDVMCISHASNEWYWDYQSQAGTPSAGRPELNIGSTHLETPWN